jgi:hypothetical protein
MSDLLDRNLIVDMIRGIAEEDYPVRWQNILPQIMTFVRGSDATAVYASLLALRALFWKYGFVTSLCERTQVLLILEL